MSTPIPIIEEEEKHTVGSENSPSKDQIVETLNNSPSLVINHLIKILNLKEGDQQYLASDHVSTMNLK